MGKLTTAREAALEKAKKESLEENQKAEIEARIDRAIKMTRLSNSETTQITIHFGNDYPGYLLQEVLEKYQAEGYFATLESIQPELKRNELLTDARKIKYDLVISWDALIHKQIMEAKEAQSNKEIINQLDSITDADDKSSLNTYNWLDEFQADSWDRAIHFANMCFRGTDEEKEFMSDITGVVVISNIIGAFLLKIFGKDYSNNIDMALKYIDRELFGPTIPSCNELLSWAKQQGYNIDDLIKIFKSKQNIYLVKEVDLLTLKNINYKGIFNTYAEADHYIQAITQQQQPAYLYDIVALTAENFIINNANDADYDSGIINW